jgi:hypothetical protein
MREDIPVSKRVRAAFMVNTDEYMALKYIAGKKYFDPHIMIVIWDQGFEPNY